MERASTSTADESTPLVQRTPRQPEYVFEASVTRRYRRRLRSFQCCICVAVIAIFGIALLVAVSYTLDMANATANRSEPLNLTAPAPKDAEIEHILTLDWPIPDASPTPWADSAPSLSAQAAAAQYGGRALAARRRLEAALRPLPSDSPARRAALAVATAPRAAQLAEGGYAAHRATEALAAGIPIMPPGGVGTGPPISAPWLDAAYCAADAGAPDGAASCAPARYRAPDGRCNNRARRWGVAFTPFRRALPPDYADGVGAPRAGSGQLPSAREVSVRAHRPRYSADAAFSVMLAVWGQFLDHDITATALSSGANGSAIPCCAVGPAGLRAHPECFPVRVSRADPYYARFNLTCMEFVRSAPAPACRFGPRQQLNQVTAFIDGSVVYGASAAATRALRSLRGGRLRMLSAGGRELLPRSTDPADGCNQKEMSEQGKYCFLSGDARANENLHLTTMHLVWARQHNRLAAALETLNPGWSDETLFQESRRILGAQMQHITYTEFLPIVLGQDVMDALKLTVRSSGYADTYNESVDPTVANHFAAAAFRFAHTLLPSLMRSVDAANGSAAYVQLHEMLFNPYPLYGARGAADALLSAMRTPVARVDPHVSPELSTHLFERTAAHGPCGLDLVSLNVQRGRDHGLPAYGAWRAHCGLARPARLQDLRGIFDEDSARRVGELYAQVDDIDLYTGALSEQPRGRLLGPTLTCLLADQFLRLRIGDRFWYETKEGPQAFTLEQLTEIRKTTLASVICANADSLAQAQLRVMESAGPSNALVPCGDIPQPDFGRFWADTDGAVQAANERAGTEPSENEDARPTLEPPLRDGQDAVDTRAATSDNVRSLRDNIQDSNSSKL